MATESFRGAEDKDAAYEYLCRLEEAKKWLEEVLNVQLPSATQLEAALQNGVVLCRLGMKLLPGDPMWKKVYDLNESKFKKKGLDYRYTDNINFWLISLHKLGLPKVFYPVMTDIFHMRNMPKLIYCLHALSHLMKRQGKVQQAVDDLYGRAKFSPTAISQTSKTLRASDLPAFSVVENLVEEELQYQALGLSDSFDESEPPAMNGAVKNGEGEEEEERGRRDVVEPVFDDPKYVSSSWAQGTLLKLQLNGSSDVADSKSPFAEVQCLDNTITAHLYSKRTRRKKNPSAVDKALVNINTALDSGSDQEVFTALQNKEANLPFVYSDHQDRYAAELKKERTEGIPKNVLIVYSGLTRETCVDLLEKMNPGAFIVRTSKTVTGAVVVSFRNQTGIKHWQMTDKDGRYYWGSSAMYDTLESFIEHFADALSQVTHLHVYPGMTTVLQPQLQSTEHQTMISKLRQMDGSLTYGQICRVIKGVNSEIRQDRKESVGRHDKKGLPGQRGAPDDQLIPKLALPRDWDSTMVISVNRVQAEQILNKEGSPGSFLVRPSEKTLGDYALAFRTSSEVRHWKIVQDKDKFFVHPRPNPYDSLEEIIQHFQEAVGQETGLVMTPLVHNWSHDILQVSGATGSAANEETDPLKPLPPVSPRHRTSAKSSTIGRTAVPSPSLSKLNPANLTSWTVEDVGQWLVQQGLGQFIEVFRENLVDGECLMTLDNTLLKEDLGITALGHRSRIMKRVTELKTSVHPAVS